MKEGGGDGRRSRIGEENEEKDKDEEEEIMKKEE